MNWKLFLAMTICSFLNFNIGFWFGWYRRGIADRHLERNPGIEFSGTSNRAVSFDNPNSWDQTWHQ